MTNVDLAPVEMDGGDESVFVPTDVEHHELPIRSIDFYYPEFQAANVLIFRDKSEICCLESANEAIFVHKLVRKANRSINTIKTGMFWTTHSMRPHWASIHLTNGYSTG